MKIGMRGLARWLLVKPAQRLFPEFTAMMLLMMRLQALRMMVDRSATPRPEFLPETEALIYAFIARFSRDDPRRNRREGWANANVMLATYHFGVAALSPVEKALSHLRTAIECSRDTARFSRSEGFDNALSMASTNFALAIIALDEFDPFETSASLLQDAIEYINASISLPTANTGMIGKVERRTIIAIKAVIYATASRHLPHSVAVRYAREAITSIGEARKSERALTLMGMSPIMLPLAQIRALRTLSADAELAELQEATAILADVLDQATRRGFDGLMMDVHSLLSDVQLNLAIHPDEPDRLTYAEAALANARNAISRCDLVDQYDLLIDFRWREASCLCALENWRAALSILEELVTVKLPDALDRAADAMLRETIFRRSRNCADLGALCCLRLDDPESAGCFVLLARNIEDGHETRLRQLVPPHRHQELDSIRRSILIARKRTERLRRVSSASLAVQDNIHALLEASQKSLKAEVLKLTRFLEQLGANRLPPYSAQAYRSDTINLMADESFIIFGVTQFESFAILSLLDRITGRRNFQPFPIRGLSTAVLGDLASAWHAHYASFANSVLSDDNHHQRRELKEWSEIVDKVFAIALNSGFGEVISQLNSIATGEINLVAPNQLALLPLHALHILEGAPDAKFSFRYCHWLPSVRKRSRRLPDSRQMPRRLKALLISQTSPAVPRLTLVRPSDQLVSEELFREAASAASVRDALAFCDVALFLCHGRWEPFDEAKCGLELFGPELLTTDEIIATDLADKRPTIVLLACEAGLVSDLHQSQESRGIPAAFLRAGAREVVAPHWPVYVSSAILIGSAALRAVGNRSSMSDYIGLTEKAMNRGSPRSPVSDTPDLSILTEAEGELTHGAFTEQAERLDSSGQWAAFAVHVA